MATLENCFVEWKEEYVSKERGNRVVHYFLKGNSGESVLAVVGTERSVRHMFYVVSEEFLSVHGPENLVHAGFRWRSRREVVNWLTSMLSKQHWQESPKDDPTSKYDGHRLDWQSHKSPLARNLKSHHLGIAWSGLAWTCCKQLKHYPSFYRNGVSITVQSFVFVMAEKENRYVAYVEDMYEDKKCQKKVKVRWFHLNKEVAGVVSLRNPHPKEVFITPYVQVISAECVDGPATVLTREHYEKCLAVFPRDLLGNMHFCFRQFKSNRVKTFKLSKLRGYFDQPIFSCFSPKFFEEEFSSDDDLKVGAKRNRSRRDHQKLSDDLPFQQLKCDLLSRGSSFLKHVEGQFWNAPTFTLNEKVEFLCQDSGIRGCWFRCSVLEVYKRRMKILYENVKDEDGDINLEEWIPTYRVAQADKLGMRHPGRPTVRPVYHCNQRSLTFKVGDPVDAWWSDGWWEGVISNSYDSKNGCYQMYIPGERLYLNVELKNLRVSRDWVGGQWVDIKPNPNIFSVISSTNMDTKVSKSPAVSKETKSDNYPTFCHDIVTAHKLSAIEEEIHDSADMTLNNVPLKDIYGNNEQQHVVEAEEIKYIDHAHKQDLKETMDYDLIDAEVHDKESPLNGNSDDANREIKDNLVKLETTEPKNEGETVKNPTTSSPT
ncbi:uncharacterized protein [Primulina huaijiensis]|uniref:uncharacterized protein isoform X1 n=1 Tax=Primulina huaijiensis TaxID=1492673 RepID=UPI003CC6EE07